VFVFTRLGNEEVLRCLALGDGTGVWQLGYHAEMKLDGAVGRFGNCPRATPTVHAGRVFTLGAGGVLTCVQADNGKQLWQHTFTDRYPRPYPDFGAAASPLVVDGLCVVPIGGKGRGALAAFDVASGEEKWVAGADGPAYASPVVLTLGGIRQIVTQTQAAVVGVSLAGETLWSIPFATQYDQNIVTAVARGDVLIYSGTHQPLTAIRVTAAGPPAEVWRNPAHPLYLSSPVLKDGLLFGMSERNGGHLFCVDTQTGSTLWQTAGGAGAYVSLQRAGDLLVLLNDQGRLAFAKAEGRAYEALREYQLGRESTLGHPVIAERRVLVKDRLHLTCYRLD
jgi:outer membrane protein assembly factor BamB